MQQKASADWISRELIRRPPGRIAPPSALTDDQVKDAIAYNSRRYAAGIVRILQDVVGAPVTGVVDEETIHFVTEWQADFRLPVDGKIGLGTLRPIVRELVAGRQHNTAIWLIIDGHDLPTRGLTSIRFDATLAGSNARTSGPIPGNSRVRIAPQAFARGYEALVHTIAHELEHVRQRRAGIASPEVREFLSELVEIRSVGMLPESFANFMSDASRMLRHWNQMTPAQRTTHRQRFIDIRAVIRGRFNRVSAAQRAAHQNTMNTINAAVVPPP
jgi:hypothetical protein